MEIVYKKIVGWTMVKNGEVIKSFPVVMSASNVHDISLKKNETVVGAVSSVGNEFEVWGTMPDGSEVKLGYHTEGTQMNSNNINTGKAYREAISKWCKDNTEWIKENQRDMIDSGKFTTNEIQGFLEV